MQLTDTLAYVVFPYIALTIFALGHGWRYLLDSYGWNARSSEFLEKRQLSLPVTIFHWGILLVLLGHIGGLLIPQHLLEAIGLSARTHILIAHVSGVIAGTMTFVGLGALLYRRLTNPRVRCVTSRNDLVTVGGLIVVVATGLYTVLFGQFDVLTTIAPWIRGVITFTPDSTLMLEVPLCSRVHVLSALALLAFSPFSRLVHIWSAPLSYFLRSWIVFRRRVAH
ncbi:MAG: respiratory nitrate reductase subunit gamma [Desulfopila sp.]